MIDDPADQNLMDKPPLNDHDDEEDEEERDWDATERQPVIEDD